MLTSLARVATTPADLRDDRPAYRAFDAVVTAVQDLSPSFRRVTFGGEQLEDFGTAGLDQRVKIVLPLPDRGFETFPRSEDWYGDWRALPAEERNPFRTYTVRAVRTPHSDSAYREVDVDFVVHGESGPASAWASHVVPGDAALLVGPDDRSTGRTIGIDWRPGDVDTLLLAGDETAAPAICAVLEALPSDAVGCALIEIPSAADAVHVDAPRGVTVRWLARDAAGRTGAHGCALIPAVRDWTVRLHAGTGHAALEDVDIDREMLWDVPVGTSIDGDLYAWLAGEASVIKTLRRFLVSEAGLDRRAVAFMGYWRLGRAELD